MFFVRNPLSIPKGPIQSGGGGETAWPNGQLSIPKGPIQSKFVYGVAVVILNFQFQKDQFKGGRGASGSGSPTYFQFQKDQFKALLRPFTSPPQGTFNSKRTNSKSCHQAERPKPRLLSIPKGPIQRPGKTLARSGRRRFQFQKDQFKESPTNEIGTI